MHSALYFYQHRHMHAGRQYNYKQYCCWIIYIFPCFQFRILEINGNEVASKSQREVVSLLRENYKGAIKIVITRPPESDGVDYTNPSPTGDVTPSGSATQRYEKLISSLTAQLDFQASEVDHWRQDCDRCVDDVLLLIVLQTM